MTPGGQTPSDDRHATVRRVETKSGVSAKLARWAATLELADVPARVVAFARSQLVAQLAAARGTLGHSLGDRIVAAFGPPLQPDPARAAYSLAALTIALDFDDTCYAGHVSHSAVNVPLAYAASLGLDGRSLLTAQIAANECAARITAAATLGPFRGQTAAHAHLAGAVAARLRAQGEPWPRWVDALGLALAAPPWTLFRGFVASDAKLLSAANAVRAGLDACDGALAGLRGAPDIVEHPDGFLARFADVPLVEAATAGLGERWHTETLSFKPYPGSAYIQAAVDCAIDLHGRLADVAAVAIEEVVVHASLLTLGADGGSAPYLRGPESELPALSFSIPYNVATALVRGDLEVADLERDRIADATRWRLADRVRVEHDQSLTRAVVGSTAPVGEALRQAGDRAAEWARDAGGDAAASFVDGLGPPSETFERAEKAVGARVVVRLRDGSELEACRPIAAGAAGGETRASHRQLTRSKFLRCGGSAALADALEHVEGLGAAQLARTLAQALDVPGS